MMTIVNRIKKIAILFIIISPLSLCLSTVYANSPFEISTIKSPLSNRITVYIKNMSDEVIQCKHILCGDIQGLDVGDKLNPSQVMVYHATSNDRIFSDWSGLESGDVYKIAMTCPKSSHNSAAGYGNGGLQHYSRTGTPVTFRFNLGNKDLADWDNGDEYHGEAPEYGDCS